MEEFTFDVESVKGGVFGEAGKGIEEVEEVIIEAETVVRECVVDEQEDDELAGDQDKIEPAAHRDDDKPAANSPMSGVWIRAFESGVSATG